MNNSESVLIDKKYAEVVEMTENSIEGLKRTGIRIIEVMILSPMLKEPGRLEI